jgi:hypothetical protein
MSRSSATGVRGSPVGVRLRRLGDDLVEHLRRGDGVDGDQLEVDRRDLERRGHAVEQVAADRDHQRLAGRPGRVRHVVELEVLERDRELALGLERDRLGDPPRVRERELEHAEAGRRARQDHPDRVVVPAAAAQHADAELERRGDRLVAAGVLDRRRLDGDLEHLQRAQAGADEHHLHFVRAEVETDVLLGHVSVLAIVSLRDQSSR